MSQYATKVMLVTEVTGKVLSCKMQLVADRAPGIKTWVPKAEQVKRVPSQVYIPYDQWECSMALKTHPRSA